MRRDIANAKLKHKKLKAKYKDAIRTNKEHEEKEALLEGQLKAAEVARADLVKLHNKKVQKMQKEIQRIKAENDAVEKELQAEKDRLREKLAAVREKNKSLVSSHDEVRPIILRFYFFSNINDQKVARRNEVIEEELKSLSAEVASIRDKSGLREKQLQGLFRSLSYEEPQPFSLLYLLSLSLNI